MKLGPFNINKIDVGAAGNDAGEAGGFNRLRGSSRGKLSLGVILLIIVFALIIGLNPIQILGLSAGQTRSQANGRNIENMTEEQLCNSNPYAQETCKALTSLNETWEKEFSLGGSKFQAPKLRFPILNNFGTACGPASVGMGPFYCPANETIYIDTGFYDNLADLSGEGGDFARYYVVAHEYGHHIQQITGTAKAIRDAQQQRPHQKNVLQVKLELQADCLAGVWAGKNADKIEAGDMQEGLRAASAIGDDTLQRESGSQINPESFTHGTSAERMEALKTGMESADIARCQRFLSL